MPLFLIIVQVLLTLLPCYLYDTVLILTLGYPLYTNWYIH